MGAFNMVSNCDTCLKSQETDSLNGKTSINRGETPLKTLNTSTANICEPLRWIETEMSNLIYCSSKQYVRIPREDASSVPQFSVWKIHTSRQ